MLNVGVADEEWCISYVGKQISTVAPYSPEFAWFFHRNDIEVIEGFDGEVVSASAFHL